MRYDAVKTMIGLAGGDSIYTPPQIRSELNYLTIVNLTDNKIDVFSLIDNPTTSNPIYRIGQYSMQTFYVGNMRDGILYNFTNSSIGTENEAKKVEFIWTTENLGQNASMSPSVTSTGSSTEVKITAANLTANGALKVAIVENDIMPTGAVVCFAMAQPPTNWLECNGQAISRNTYAALFATIGTLYGSGDGTTTFNVPDLRGEFIRGWDNVRGVDTDRVFGSSQTDMYESHNHTTLYELDGESLAAGSVFRQFLVQFDSQNNVVTSNSGGTETRPRNIALLYCIKT